MKIDRLLGITIYLMNHGAVSAQKLAARFEVSKRTIQRDINSLCLAGIPVISTFGSDGGYEIVDQFGLSKQVMGHEDYAHIITALKGLQSAYDDQKINATLDKLLVQAEKSNTQKLFLDFGVLREGENVSKYIGLLQQAIEQNKTLHIQYTDSNNTTTRRLVEPLALTYQWYAWYLLAYCTHKKAYRLFKVPRISKVEFSTAAFSIVHENAEELLKKASSTNARRHLDIKLLCKADIKVQALEYLGSHIAQEFDNGDFILEMHVPDNERMWFSLLLGFGDQVIVLEPDELKDRLKQKATDILKLYF